MQPEQSHIRKCDGKIRCVLQDRWIRYCNADEVSRRKLKPPAPYRTWVEMELDLKARGQIR